jgi:PhnB protein
VNNSTGYMRHGRGAARSHLYGDQAVADFIKTAFGAVELERNHQGRGIYHTELLIGDSVVILKASEASDSPRPPGVTYVFVSAGDVVYQRALTAGATTVKPPADKLHEPLDIAYHRRACSTKDSFGNLWKIGTYFG